MHRISKQSAQNAQEHATIALRHGFSVELQGKFLQRRDEPTLQEYGHFIEDYGQIIQQYAEESLRYSQSLHNQDYSTKLYGLAVEAHVKAAVAHVGARANAP
ncbi:MAG: hypothetical protein PUP93_06905 [Rhizonema sp. NSF051]|nr:hypothetical protein [Rhizonema sp. NSF051]